MKLYTLIILAVVLTSSLAEAKGKGKGQCHGTSGQGSCGCSCSMETPKASAAVLSEAEAHYLRFMREEEKLARDVYNTLGALYDQRVFANIPRAEQHHMDAVLGLLEAYGLQDSATSEPGQFNDPKLQALYDSLVARGSKSREEAFLVGALVEEVDILDLEEAIKSTENPSIQTVLEALLGGSHRHLNAFVHNYESASGKTYIAQKMSPAEVDSILGR